MGAPGSVRRRLREVARAGRLRRFARSRADAKRKGQPKDPNAAARDAVLSIVACRRGELLERATDWVIGTAADLQGKRPREETRRLVDRVITTNVAVIESGDRAPLRDFIEHVTSLRAAHEFRVSTILRGFLSFARGLEEVMREEAVPPCDALRALKLVDDVYHEAVFEISDVYGEKLIGTVQARRRDLELELGEKRGDLEQKIATIEAQRAMLAALSSPIVSVWEGILLVPLVGEISPDRAEHAKRKLLDAILERDARVVLLDVTGLSVADAHAASVLASMIRATRLVGAESMVVGMRGDAARMFVAIGEVFSGARTFATLGDGLRHAIRRASAD